MAQNTSMMALLALAIMVLPVSARTIWIYGPTGDDSNSGLAEPLAKKTIQAGLDAAQSGDLIIIKGNTAANPTIYYENPSLNGTDNVWILAHPRGSVVITDMHQAAREGTQTWRSDGDNRWRISLNKPPWIMGYRDPSGRDWFLPEYTCNDLDDHVANFCGGQPSAAIPEYGYCHDSGTLRVRLPDKATPNGKTVKIGTRGRYTGVVLNISNSTDVILDGMVFEGAGNRCVVASPNSTGLIIRNVDFQYCREGARVGNNTTISWSRYTYPGYADLEDALHSLGSGDANNRAAFNLVKNYAIDRGNCTTSTIEGTIALGYDHTSGLEIEYSVVHSVMDGLRFFGVDGAEVHHSIFSRAVDNLVEFESDSGAGCFDNTVSYSYFQTRGYDPWSGQSKKQLCKGTLHHNVVQFVNDSPHFDTTHGLWKYNVDNNSTRYYTYNNTIILNEREIWTVDPDISRVHVLRNNIFYSSTGNLERSYNGTLTSNALVSPSNRSWMISSGGVHSSSLSALNFIDFNNGNFGITSGSLAEGIATSIPGITTSSDAGAFAVGETPGAVASAPGIGVWPRPFDMTYDENTPSGWFGDLPPSDLSSHDDDDDDPGKIDDDDDPGKIDDDDDDDPGKIDDDNDPIEIDDLALNDAMWQALDEISVLCEEISCPTADIVTPVDRGQSHQYVCQFDCVTVEDARGRTRQYYIALLWDRLEPACYDKQKTTLWFWGEYYYDCGPRVAK